MALATSKDFLANNDRGTPTFPASFTSGWIDAIDPTGMNARDGTTPGTVVNPTLDITTNVHRILRRGSWRGTSVVARLAYATAATVSAGGTIKCFGRANSDDQWMLLKTKSGAVSLAFTVDATNDARDGTLSYTTPTLSTDAFDCCGCDEILFGVTVAHATDASYAALAKLQVKVI